ncbi:hypothetical protein BZA70DRAFT_282467, partial [Myxozyma melibiosi]
MFSDAERQIIMDAEEAAMRAVQDMRYRDRGRADREMQMADHDSEDDEEERPPRRQAAASGPGDVQEKFFKRLFPGQLRTVRDQSEMVATAWNDLKQPRRRPARFNDYSDSDEDYYGEEFNSDDEEEAEHERPDGVLLRYHYGCWWDYPPALAKHIYDSFQEHPRIYERWDRNRVDPNGLALRLGVTIMTEPMISWVMRYERERSEVARRKLYPSADIYAKYIETVSAEAARMRATTPDRLLKVESDYPDEVLCDPLIKISDVKAAVRVERKSQVRSAMAEMLSIFARRPNRKEARHRGIWWNDLIDVNLSTDDVYGEFEDFEQDEAYAWPRYPEEVKQAFGEPVEAFYERLLKVARLFRIEEPRITEAFFHGLRKFIRSRLERFHESNMNTDGHLLRLFMAARQLEVHVYQSNLMKRMEEINEREEEREWEEEF